MKTDKNRTVRLLVLVPHRDTRRQLKLWSASLFANGMGGAWSFPWVAPFAKLRRNLSAEELKRLARSLRQEVNLIDMPEVENVSRKGVEAQKTKVANISRKGASNLRFATQRTQRLIRGADQAISVVLHEDGIDNDTLSVFGPSLDIKLPDGFFNDIGEAVISPISPIVLGSAVLFSPIPSPQSPVPTISFRAAALANMSYRVLASGNGLYFEWKIGSLHWLPKMLAPIKYPRD